MAEQGEQAALFIDGGWYPVEDCCYAEFVKKVGRDLRRHKVSGYQLGERQDTATPRYVFLDGGTGHLVPLGVITHGNEDGRQAT